MKQDCKLTNEQLHEMCCRDWSGLPGEPERICTMTDNEKEGLKIYKEICKVCVDVASELQCLRMENERLKEDIKLHAELKKYKNLSLEQGIRILELGNVVEAALEWSMHGAHEGLTGVCACVFCERLRKSIAALKEQSDDER